MASKQKTVYCCSECGNTTANWAGKCPSCGQWNTLKEIVVDAKKEKKASASVFSQRPKKLSELECDDEIRRCRAGFTGSCWRRSWYR